VASDQERARIEAALKPWMAAKNATNFHNEQSQAQFKAVDSRSRGTRKRGKGGE
jgi:hypothetical protein